MRIVRMVAVWLALLAAGCAETAPDDADAAEHRDPVGCVITGDRTCEVGKVPRLVVTLTNQTDADIYLVGSLDASDSKWRYPHCTFEVSGPPRNPPPEYGRCGNMNSLRVEDFVKVPPGGGFDPTRGVWGSGWLTPDHKPAAGFSVPGVYRVRFVYSAKCDDIGQWNGFLNSATVGDEVAARFGREPKVEVRSDEFVVTVLAPGGK